jgi:hypothetical protein
MIRLKILSIIIIIKIISVLIFAGRITSIIIVTRQQPTISIIVIKDANVIVLQVASSDEKGAQMEVHVTS